MAAGNLLSYRRQKLLLEFAALKHVQLQGIYVSLTPGDSSQWNGVLFVRKGPYAPAILRFRMIFPNEYPSKPPTVVFATDVFHPLLTPLTTATFSSGQSSPGGEPDQRLPPGAFNIRHGFSRWQHNPEPINFAEPVSPETPSSPTAARSSTASEEPSAVDVLLYVRSCFQDENILDQIPLVSAANPGAWYAWRSYRSKIKPEFAIAKPTPRTHEQADTPARPKGPSEWNWDGVWEERTRRSVQGTLTELSLYGGPGSVGREDEVYFVKLDQERLDRVQAELHKLALLEQ